jgi:hypothetical protein
MTVLTGRRLTVDRDRDVVLDRHGTRTAAINRRLWLSAAGIIATARAAADAPTAIAIATALATAGIVAPARAAAIADATIAIAIATALATAGIVATARAAAIAFTAIAGFRFRARL